jgi:oxygen-dependent protoporphyrinogen oxidase
VRAAGVHTESKGYTVRLAQGQEFRAAAVILAIPAFAASGLLFDVDRRLYGPIDGIRYVSTATVSLAYPRSHVGHPLDGYGYVVPRAEGRSVLACTWASTKFSGRAPEGSVLLRAFVGRAGQEDTLGRTNEQLLELVRAELEGLLEISAEPILWRVYRWPRAMPQYELGYPQKLEVIEERLRAHPGLLVAGSAYRGVGIPDCIESGERAAAAALAHL